jgi:opacity protein-like surface antigen
MDEFLKNRLMKRDVKAFTKQIGKKGAVVFAFILLSVVFAHAGIRIGIKGGVNLAKASFNTEAIEAENFVGFQLGPVVEISSLTGLGFDIAALYSQQGFKLKGREEKQSNDLLEVPVNLKYKTGLLGAFSGYLTAGPYVAFKLDESKLSEVVVEEIARDFRSKSFGAGVNFGLGLELLEHLQVGINYRLGLTNDYESYDLSSLLIRQGNLTEVDGKAKIRIWSITATYFF